MLIMIAKKIALQAFDSEKEPAMVEVLVKAMDSILVAVTLVWPDSCPVRDVMDGASNAHRTIKRHRESFLKADHEYDHTLCFGNITELDNLRAAKVFMSTACAKVTSLDEVCDAARNCTLRSRPHTSTLVRLHPLACLNGF